MDHSQEKLRVAVFASGSGTNFEALLHHSYSMGTQWKIAALVTNKPECRAADIALMYDVEVLTTSAGQEPRELENELLIREIDMIVLAGYLRKIPLEIVRRWERRMVNIHPSLLPKFGGHGMYGLNVHRAVLEAGEELSGATVHFVSEEYDEGEIIAQETVPVVVGDTPETLAQRVQTIEHMLYPKALDKVAMAAAAR